MMKVPKIVPKNFDPFLFECNMCGKTKKYTQEKIDKEKKTHPNPKEYAYDFYIPCPFCKEGYMEPPTFVAADDIFFDFDEE